MVTPEVVVRYQLVDLRPQLAKMTHDVSLLGHAPVSELQAAILILQQRRKLSWIVQDHHAVPSELISMVLLYTPVAVDVTEVHAIAVTHERGHVPEHTQICPAIECISNCSGLYKQSGRNKGARREEGIWVDPERDGAARYWRASQDRKQMARNQREAL